ncbi:MAG: peptide ligase PGM1-related protein [Acidimicrobiia bacterium]|nr:peptide ligase PGM1-related protein [Acidimicrobiia bacterium]
MGFEEVQASLAAVQAANRPGSTQPHLVVVLPSFSVGESLLSHYADRIPALEHRFLVAILMLRITTARLAIVVTQHPGQEVVDYYLDLLPGVPDARDRLEFIVVEDTSARPVAAKLLERPDLIARIRNLGDGLPAVVEPWNVAGPEAAVAERLGMPINGTPPDVWPVAFKSAGRRLMASAGVPVPAGFEHLHSADEAVSAIERLRSERPGMRAVVLKHDDSGAGDGNAVIDLSDLEAPGSRLARARLRSRVRSLPPWYVADLAKGFVVEERIEGDRFSSPSVQIDVFPDGEVRVLSSHEQILGGDDGQVYLGCRFPADTAYGPIITRHAEAVGRALGSQGAVGRAAIDFVVAARGEGDWEAYALEINLRRSGTTHPFTVLRHLVPGAYDLDSGLYRSDAGVTKFYSATDNLVDEKWTGISPADVIGAVRDAGLAFADGNGVVLHMLSCLAIDGRFGLTAIADSREEADRLVDATRTAVDEMVVRRA